MNKDKLLGYLINLVGWSMIIVPAAGIYYDNFYAIWYSLFAYLTLSLYAVWYFIGSLRCSIEVSKMIMVELRETNTWVSYIPVVAILGISGYAYYQDYTNLAIAAIFPLFLNSISKVIIGIKASQ